MNPIAKIFSAGHIMPIEKVGGRTTYIKQTKSKFRCLHCGYCCTMLVELKDQDIKRLEKLGFSDFIDTKTLRDKKVIKLINGFCTFLKIEDGKSSCKIYEHRPKPCRLYPFLGDYIGYCCPPTLYECNRF